MTCVWEGLMEGLRKYKLIEQRTKLDTFVQHIKKNNVRVSSVTCNGQLLTRQQIEENYDRIRSIKKISNGYNCSACDPLLILICYIYHINIVHKLHGHAIEYCIHNSADSHVLRTLFFGSDDGHFWFVN